MIAMHNASEIFRKHAKRQCEDAQPANMAIMEPRTLGVKGSINPKGDLSGQFLLVNARKRVHGNGP
jgi:hypothetical protein